MRTMSRVALALMLCTGGSMVAHAQAPSPALKAANKSVEEGKETSAVEAEEHHHHLSAHHHHVLEHAKLLHHHARTHKAINREAAKEHADEMGRGLEGAKKHHAAIEKATAGDEKLKAHHQKIHEHHQKASEHYSALQSELAKPTPDAKVVAEHSAHIHHHIKQAENEHVALKKARKIKEPAEPPAPATP